MTHIRILLAAPLAMALALMTPAMAEERTVPQSRGSQIDPGSGAPQTIRCLRGGPAPPDHRAGEGPTAVGRAAEVSRGRRTGAGPASASGR